MKWNAPARLHQFAPRHLTHRLKHELKHFRWQDHLTELAALGFAVLFFFVARQPTSDIRLPDVPLEFRGLRDGLEITAQSEQKVSVRLRGPRDALRGLLPNQIAVLADLTDKDQGERVVRLKPDDVTRPDNVSVLRIEPASIRLKIEPTGRKQVKVEPQLLGAAAEGFEVYRAVAAPPTIEVEGPQSHLTQLDSVRTESIRLNGRRENFTAAVEVELPNPKLHVTTRSGINIAVEIGERRHSRLLSNLPVLPTDRAARLLPDTVEVVLYGPRSMVDGLRAGDVRVEVDPTPTDEALTPRVILPAAAAGRIEIKSIKPDKVKVKR